MQPRIPLNYLWQGPTGWLMFNLVVTRVLRSESQQDEFLYLSSTSETCAHTPNSISMQGFYNLFLILKILSAESHCHEHCYKLLTLGKTEL